MGYLVSILLGYTLGCINPTYLISKFKNVNIRDEGTGNLGASNATMVLGKAVGSVVLIFDILKSYIAVVICRMLFPNLVLTGLIGGCSAVIGHCLPFYLKFKGGKGLASLAGLILALNPLHFLVMLLVCCTITIAVNHICALPISASIIFPFITMHQHATPMAFLIMGICSTVIIIRHRENFFKALRGEDGPKVRDVLKKAFGNN